MPAPQSSQLRCKLDICPIPERVRFPLQALVTLLRFGGSITLGIAADFIWSRHPSLWLIP